MKKPLAAMAEYLKSLIPVDIPEAITVRPLFLNVSDAESIQQGVLAFRGFLFQLYDSLSADGNNYDKPSKTTDDEILDHTSLAVEYPFLNNVKSILINIGYHGKFTENGDSLLITDWQSLTTAISADGGEFKQKISAPKALECLQFLTCCGVHFSGIRLDAGKPDISKVGFVEVTYPGDPVMLTGMKVMAIAQKELRTKGNDDVFLRCDYRVLTIEETDVTLLLKDFIRPLPAKVQDFALQLHQRYLDAGLTCRAEVWYLRRRFTYSHNKKEVWAFSASPNYGYRILIKAQHTQRYADVIEKFSLPLREKIARGYGCDKKRFGEPCQGGCHGFRVSLDDSLLEVCRDIEIWLDKELSCLQRK